MTTMTKVVSTAYTTVRLMTKRTSMTCRFKIAYMSVSGMTTVKSAASTLTDCISCEVLRLSTLRKSFTMTPKTIANAAHPKRARSKRSMVARRATTSSTATMAHPPDPERFEPARAPSW